MELFRPEEKTSAGAGAGTSDTGATGAGTSASEGSGTSGANKAGIGVAAAAGESAASEGSQPEPGGDTQSRSFIAESEDEHH